MTQRLLMGNLAAILLPALTLAGGTPDFESMNDAFGVPVWADANLWDDPERDVIERLEWPLESRTTGGSSARLYPKPEARVLGARPYSLAFYGRDGVADGMSMVFANKGDLGVSAEPGGRPDTGYKRQIAADAKTIRETLSLMLGQPAVDKYGQGTKTRERVERWDWEGHTILLSAQRDEYVAVRILPTAVASGGAAARTTDAEIERRLKTRVEQRPNGDVILADIPMVNQGPKGYCVPATWERALR